MLKMSCSRFLRLFELNVRGVIHLVRTQKFPKNYHFLPPDQGEEMSVFCARTKWMTPNHNASNGDSNYIPCGKTWQSNSPL